LNYQKEKIRADHVHYCIWDDDSYPLGKYGYVKYDKIRHWVDPVKYHEDGYL
jgi:hypothetical protein